MSWYSDLPQVHAAGDGGARPTTQVVVIHATDNTASAESEARYATYRADLTSAHFYNDGDSIIQALDTDEIAYGCLWHGNQISVQFELCGHSDQLTDEAMRQAAPVVARVCQQYGIPVRKIGPAEVRAGEQGICGHLDITNAFPQDGGDHTDPGPHFPWGAFIGYVAAAGQEGDDDMANFDENPNFQALAWRVEALVRGRDKVAGGPTAGEPVALHLPAVTPVQVENSERYLQSLTAMDPTTHGISNTVDRSDKPNELVTTLERMAADIAELKAAFQAAGQQFSKG